MSDVDAIGLLFLMISGPPNGSLVPDSHLKQNLFTSQRLGITSSLKDNPDSQESVRELVLAMFLVFFLISSTWESNERTTTIDRRTSGETSTRMAPCGQAFSLSPT
jgi:hypothetical protein